MWLRVDGEGRVALLKDKSQAEVALKVIAVVLTRGDLATQGTFGKV